MNKRTLNVKDVESTKQLTNWGEANLLKLQQANSFFEKYFFFFPKTTAAFIIAICLSLFSFIPSAQAQDPINNPCSSDKISDTYIIGLEEVGNNCFRIPNTTDMLMAVYVEGESLGGAGVMEFYDTELFGPDVGSNDCISRTLVIGSTDTARDVQLAIPIHEKDNNRLLDIRVQALLPDGTVVVTDTITDEMQNAGLFASLYNITMNRCTCQG